MYDSVKLERTQANKLYHENLKLISQNEQYSQEYETEYKEWNIVKKNKFGKKQDRIFGIKGRTIYNGKRGAPAPNPNYFHSTSTAPAVPKDAPSSAAMGSVQRAERDISNIEHLEKSAVDNRTFIITWRDGNDTYKIEYTCETMREMEDIYQRLEYLNNKYNKKKTRY